MTKYPTHNYTPQLSGETDQPLELQLVDLTRLSAEGKLLVIHHQGERGYHLKLILNETEAISLFVWNTKIFQNQNTLARSYGVIPIDEALPDPEEGDRLIAEGTYRLNNGILTIRVEKTYDPSIVGPCTCKYKLKLKRIKEYISPKHGHSARPEYILISLATRGATRKS